MKRKTDPPPYRSPYLLLAEYRAKERARQNLLSKNNQKIVLNNSREWNSDVRPNSLFDPNVRKVEIFKPKSSLQKNPSSSLTSITNNYKSINSTSKQETLRVFDVRLSLSTSIRKVQHFIFPL